MVNHSTSKAAGQKRVTVPQTTARKSGGQLTPMSDPHKTARAAHKKDSSKSK